MYLGRAHPKAIVAELMKEMQVLLDSYVTVAVL